jgi:hypothetical protein
MGKYREFVGISPDAVIVGGFCFGNLYTFITPTAETAAKNNFS